LFNSTGTELAANDAASVDPDTGQSSLDPALTFTASANGTYYVGVSGAPNSGYDPVSGSNAVDGSTGAYWLQVTVNQATTP
jgi:hypothetical protein